MTTTTKNKTETFLTYELTDCGVSSYSHQFRRRRSDRKVSR